MANSTIAAGDMPAPARRHEVAPKRHRRANETAKSFDITHFLNREPKTLSSGQQQHMFAMNSVAGQPHEDRRGTVKM